MFRRNRAGFTLLELLSVVIIAGVLMAIALPRFGNVIAQTKVQKAARVLSTSVQEAFVLAGRNRRPIRLVWNSNTMAFQVTDRAQATVYRTIGLGSAYGYDFVSGEITVYPSTFLELYPNGLAGDTLNVQMSHAGTTRTVRATRAGLVRVQ